MKIAVLTSGILPVPAVQGGAVENLIDFYLEYNNKNELHDITIYSVYHPDVKKQSALKSSVNHYVYIDMCSIYSRMKAKWYSLFHKDECYYYKIEYFFEQAFKRIYKQSFDLILLENRPGFAIKLHERIPTPIISHIHTNQLNESTTQNKKILSSTYAFIVVSKYIKKEIESIGQSVNIKVVYNGLDDKLFNKNSIKPINRLSLGFKDDDFIALFSGRLVPEKGIMELLQSMILLKDYPEIKLIVLGCSDFDDNSNTNDFTNKLQKVANQLGNRIIFTGFVPYNIIPRYLAAADIAIVPSHINEAFGMTCIEACAMGLPVIATNDGGIPETLSKQKCIIIGKGESLDKMLAESILKIKKNIASYQGNHLNHIFSKDCYSKSIFRSL